MSKEERIDFVISCFRAMGGTDEKIVHERLKLENDLVYFQEWCKDIKNWCNLCPDYLKDVYK